MDSDLRLCTIGTAAAWPNADEPSSGFVLRCATDEKVHHLLLECGTGVAARLHQLGFDQIDDVIVTHAHADHSYDLVPLRYDYEYGNRMDQAAPSLHVNQDTRGRLETQISAVSDDPAAWWDQGFSMRQLQDGQIGPWSVSLLPVEHFIPSVAVRFEFGGRSFVFSSDCGEGSIDDLIEFSRGCNLLVCEAALPSICPADHPARFGHLDPAQAALIAREAGADRLLLTHVPFNYDVASAVQAAQAVFERTQHTRSGDVHLI